MTDIPWNVWLSWWLKTHVVGFMIDPQIWVLAVYLFLFIGIWAALRIFGSR